MWNKYNQLMSGEFWRAKKGELRFLTGNSMGGRVRQKGVKCWKGSQITNKVSNVEWKGSQMLKRTSNNE